MNPTLSSLGIVCALGRSKGEVWQNAYRGDILGMRPLSELVPDRSVMFGVVQGSVPAADNRTNSLLSAAMSQIEDDVNALKDKYGADRIGVCLGSSNTGVHEAQHCVDEWLDTGIRPDKFKFSDLALGTPAEFLRNLAGVSGPAYVVSTACTSSAKAMISARRLLERDLCDAVLTGGADGLCRFALNGFNALSALSLKLANPFSQNRDGINLGEAAALFIMEKNGEGVAFLGAGESSDAYHLTAPDPSGRGAIAAMRRAVSDAGLRLKDIDYINLHGTGTLHNDAAEGLAVSEVFGDFNPLCSSTKPMTGHALGASAATEAALCWLMLSDFNDDNSILPHVYDGVYDNDIPRITLAEIGEKRYSRYVLSNAFAFGGSNASLILGRRDV